MATRKRAGRNRTMTITSEEIRHYKEHLVRLDAEVSRDTILNKVICRDIYTALPLLPTGFVDLLFLDPPYNLGKNFNGRQFRKRPLQNYTSWIDSWLRQLARLLKRTASVYICSDWRSSTAVEMAARKYFKIRNRITWEREKGRGALQNWKNASEDIWFCTVSDDYTFNTDAVKLKREVIAPYTHANGRPKDWEKSQDGNFRLTHPSNLWTDLTVPFWSMPENTDHPTQKPEKLLAKIILASSNEGDVLLDPFAGSGTACVVAKKLSRHFVGIEIDETYCSLALKRLDKTRSDTPIQGYRDGVFWERNTFQKRLETEQRNPAVEQQSSNEKSTLFEFTMKT